MTRAAIGIIVFIAVIGVAFAVSLRFGLPMRGLPPTTALIGAISDLATDPASADLFSVGRRRVPFQMLYPAETPGEAAAYVPDAAPLIDAITQGRGWMARLFLGQIGNLTAPWMHAAKPAAGGPFPVIIYLPGVTGYMQMGSFQTSALAAQGYVVVTLDQPGAGAAAMMPDHQIIRGLTREQAASLIAPSYRATGMALPADFAGKLAPEISIVPYFAADVPLVLDRLATINADPSQAWHGLLDLKRIGVMGMSLGAIVTAQACAMDARIGACLMMDAPVPTDVATTGLRQPALWISRPKDDQRLERAGSGGWPEIEIDAQAATIDQAVSNSYHGEMVQVRGLFHLDFTDLPAIQPAFGWLGQSGSTGAVDAHRQINQLTAAFFASAFGAAMR